MSGLPCFLWDGQISLGEELLHMVPIPLDYGGTVKLKLIENGEVDGQIEVKGTHARIELGGEPQDVKKFRGVR
jgi:hypothetical protein